MVWGERFEVLMVQSAKSVIITFLHINKNNWEKFFDLTSNLNHSPYSNCVLDFSLTETLRGRNEEQVNEFCSFLLFSLCDKFFR